MRNLPEAAPSWVSGYIGIPFSDPVMDGPVIQEASQRALDAGATPVSILQEARELDVEIEGVFVAA